MICAELGLVPRTWTPVPLSVIVLFVRNELSPSLTAIELLVKVEFEMVEEPESSIPTLFPSKKQSIICTPNVSAKAKSLLMKLQF